MRKIDVSNLSIIDKGVTSTVYCIDDDHIVKVFRDIISLDKIQYEYKCAKLVEKLGVCTPSAQEIVDSNQGTGIIYDRVKGINLSYAIQNDKEHLYEYGVKYGHIVKSLHDKNVSGFDLPDVKEHMKHFMDNGPVFLNEKEMEEVLHYIDLIPSGNRLLHGDISPVNIMVKDEQVYIIDVPMIKAGNPLFDLLQPYHFCVQTRLLYELYMNMSVKEKKSPIGKYLARFQTRYLNEEESGKVWGGFLAGYFGRIPGEKQRNLEYTLKLYYSIQQIGSSMIRKKFGSEVVRFLQNRGWEWIREHKDEKEKIDFSL